MNVVASCEFFISAFSGVCLAKWVVSRLGLRFLSSSTKAFATMSRWGLEWSLCGVFAGCDILGVVGRWIVSASLYRLFAVQFMTARGGCAKGYTVSLCAMGIARAHSLTPWHASLALTIPEIAPIEACQARRADWRSRGAGVVWWENGRFDHDHAMVRCLFEKVERD